MIVKNEERVIERCLSSVCRAVDEIIIVDTGSSDKTKIIASQFTEKIYDFEWNDDFSAARNFSFSKATGDYIFWLDADDVLLEEDLNKFIKLKNTLDLSADIVMMKYNTAFDEGGNPVFSFFRERLIKNIPEYKWFGRVHETVRYYGNIIYSNIAITHKSIKKEYSKRNLLIYEKQIEAGEPFSARDKFYYARELYYHKYYDKSISALNDFLSDESGWIENKIEACRILSYCFSAKGDNENAFIALTHSFFYDSPRPEVCCEIGNLLMESGKYSSAVFWFKAALNSNDNEKSGAFISKDSSGYIPAVQLCVCYDKLGKCETAEYYNNLAGTYKPYSKSYLHNLEYFKKKKQ